MSKLNPVFSLLISLTFLLTPVLSQNENSNYFSEDKSYNIPYVLLVGSFFLDHTIQRIALDNQNNTADKIAKIDRYYGDKYITGGALLSLYGMSLLLDNAPLKETSEKAIIAAAVTGLVVTGLKEMFGRSRPFRGDGHMHFKPFSFEDSRRSLPSGHSSVTFAISTVMARSLNNIYWKSFWYGSALTVSAARIYKNRHWVSDVVVGNALGYFIAIKTEELFENKKATPFLGMAFQNSTAMLTLSYRF